MKYILKRRLIPQSILRQMAEQNETVEKEKPRFVKVLIQGRMKLINTKKLPNDLPSHEEWFKIRIWDDELNGRSLT
jgi:hypothetical protein